MQMAEKRFMSCGIFTVTLDKKKNKEIRCKCNHNQIVNWDLHQFIRHVKTKGHLKWENAKDTTRVLQSTLLQVEKDKEEK
jgi:hypothetical protein